MPSGKGRVDALFRHKCMKLRFLHLLSFFSKKKRLVIKGEAGLQGNITHFVLFSVMSATDASRSDRRFPVV